MFNFPATVIYHSPEGIVDLPITVDIDKVNHICEYGIDSQDVSEVESYYLSDLVPHTAIFLTDGRRLLVVERPSAILMYLDVYRDLDQDFQSTRSNDDQSLPERTHLRVISGGKCKNPSDTSVESIPD